MMRLRVATRLLDIQRVLVRHGLDEIILATHLFRPLRYAFYLSPATWFERKKGGPRGERIRLALEELGPIFVKFGQALSTRRDLLPADIADELAKLQDRVPPFPGAEARAIVEAAYGRASREVFERFDEEPLAAASIAQVHTAKLRSGEEVVIKVVRPGVRAKIERDLEVMHVLARLAHDYSKEGYRLRPTEVVAEYQKTIIDELDLMREAANAAQLRRNFAGSDLLYVPQIYWDYCRPDVMVMERIHGVLVSDMDELRARGTNIQVLAENGVEIFFTQVFRHNFFHADMHPGNIFVQVDDPERPRYAAVDFGIVGSLDARDQHYLAENFIAFFDGDYNRVARLHVDSGWVPTGHARRRTGGGDTHGVRADLQQAARGDFLRAGADAAVRDRAPLRHEGAAATDPAAEDAAADRGPRPPALPAARPVEDGAADHAGVGLRPPERPHARRSNCAGSCPTCPEADAHAAADAAAVRAESVRGNAAHPRRPGAVRGTAPRDPGERAAPRPDDRRRRRAAGGHLLAGIACRTGCPAQCWPCRAR